MRAMRFAVATLALLFGLASCVDVDTTGADDPEDPVAEETTDDVDEPDEPDEPAAVAANLERWCAVNTELDELTDEFIMEFEADPDDEDPFTTYFEAFYGRDDVQDLMQELVEVAPDDAAEDTRTVVEAINERGAEVIDDDEVNLAQDRLEAYAAEHCGDAES